MALTGKPDEVNGPLKNTNIAHIRTDLKWLDIKIVDPEMESLLKQLNEEHQKLKEALREKLRLLRYDIESVQKENDIAKQRLLEKDLQIIPIPIIKEELDINATDEPIISESENNSNIEEEVNTPITPQPTLKDVEVCITKLHPNQLMNYKIENFQKRKKLLNLNEKEMAQRNSMKTIRARRSNTNRSCRTVPYINYEENSDNEGVRKRKLHPLKRRRFLRRFHATLEKKRRMREAMESSLE